MTDERTDYPEELLESMSSLAQLVLADEDVSSTVDRIVLLAVHAIDGAEHCSISLARDGEITTVASTSEIGNAIDRLQYETGEGPCLSSIEQHATFCMAEMDKDETWPAFSKRAAAESGIRSMLSFVLALRSDAVGAVNLMSSHVDAFDDDDVATGSIFASHAAISLANALTHEADRTRIRQLEAGMESRQMIGQAVGIVMSAKQVDPDEAFAILTRISQNSNLKIRDIAARLIENAGNV